MESTNPHFEWLSSFQVSLRRGRFHVLEHEYRDLSFGSWFITLRRDGQIFRMVWDGKEHFLVFEILEDPHFFGKHNEKRWKEIGFKRFPKADYDAVSSEFEDFVSGLS